MPRTTLSETPSSLAFGLIKAGHHVLEQAWQQLSTTPHMQDEAPPHQHEWVMFTSPLGVKFFHQWLIQHRTSLNRATSIMVLGEGTARAFQHTFNRQPDYVPNTTKDAKYLVETWLQHYAGATPVRIVWPCSQLSHVEPLQQLLKPSGHQLFPWPLYCPHPLLLQQYAAHLEEALAFTPEYGILTSPSNIVTLHRAGAFDQLSHLRWMTLGSRSTQALADVAPHIQAIQLNTATAQAILNVCSL